MHNMNEGPLLKRLRIRFFGLTQKERRENAATVSQITAAVWAENAEEDRLFDEFADKHPEMLARPWQEWMPVFWRYAEAHWSPNVPKRWYAEPSL